LQPAKWADREFVLKILSRACFQMSQVPELLRYVPFGPRVLGTWLAAGAQVEPRAKKFRQ
jgi:hypothetical protein